MELVISLDKMKISYLLTATLAFAAAAQACSNDDGADDGPPALTGGSGGTGGTAGSAGTAGTGGSAGSAGSAGTGGVPGDAGTCTPVPAEAGPEGCVPCPVNATDFLNQCNYSERVRFDNAARIQGWDGNNHPALN